jgi:hypothetical protein
MPTNKTPQNVTPISVETIALSELADAHMPAHIKEMGGQPGTRGLPTYWREAFIAGFRACHRSKFFEGRGSKASHK